MRELGYTVERIARAVRGTVASAPPIGADAPVTGLSTDTRTVKAGELFIALRGDRFDGHAFLGAAVGAGAAVLVVEHASAAEALLAASGRVTVIAVDDTLYALGELARDHRATFGGTVVGITGSAGKTTTKELLAAVLERLGTVKKTHGNWNNRIGLPKTVLELRPSHRFAVIEMGTNEPGEIERLAEIAGPQIGLVTNVGRAHLEKLGSLDGVAHEKGALFRALPSDGTAIVNVDDALVERAAVQSRAATIRFGTREGADVRVLGTAPEDGGRFGARFLVRGQPVSASIGMLGRHNALNAAAAIACGLAVGVEPSQAAEAMAAVEVGAHRMAYVDAGGVNVIDDCYNANPTSMAMALLTLLEQAGPRRKVAVLGDMLELGDEAEAAHRDLGVRAGSAGLSRIFVAGRFAALVRDGAVSAGLSARAVVTAEDAAQLVEPVLADINPGDWVLVKGSRGGRLERVVDAIARTGRA